MATTATKYHGANQAVGFGEESAYATAVSRTNWRYVRSCGFQHLMALNTREHTRTSATSFNDRGSFYLGRAYWEGPLALEGNFDAIGMLLKHAVGSVTTQDDTPSSGYYTHTYVRALTFPVGLTFEANRGGDGSKELFPGGKCRDWSLSSEKGSYLKFDSNWFGAWDPAVETAPRTDTAASPSFGTDDNFITAAMGSTLAWNSTTTYMNRFSLTVDNGLSDPIKRQFIGSVTTQEPLRDAKENIMLEAEVEVNDVKFAEYVALTQGDAVIGHTFGTRAFNITVQNAQILSVSDPMPNAVGIVTSVIRWKGFTDGTDDGIKLVVVNQEASATSNG